MRWFEWCGKQHSYEGAPIGYRWRIGPYRFEVWFKDLRGKRKKES